MAKAAASARPEIRRQIQQHPGYPKPRTGFERRYLGFVLFAGEEITAIILGYGIALALYTYGIFPVTSCNILPVYCGSILGVMGAIFSGSFFLLLPGLLRVQRGRRAMVILFLIIGSLFVGIPQPAHGITVANIFTPSDYQPLTYWVIPPNNVTVNAVITSEWYVFEWWYFWSFHNPTLPGTAVTNVTWEPVYTYADIAKQTLIAVAFRYHYQWYCNVAGNITGIPCASGINAVQCTQCVSLPFGFTSPTQPIITFISNYFAPANIYPNSTQLSKIAALYGILGNFKYINAGGNYTYTVTQNPPPLGLAADPVSILTINAPLYWDITIALILFHIPWFLFVLIMARRRAGGITAGTLRGRRR